MRRAYSNGIPRLLEYLGMNEWAVRGYVQVDASLGKTVETSSSLNLKRIRQGHAERALPSAILLAHK